MALKGKAVERLLKFTKNENDPGVYRYVMKASKAMSAYFFCIIFGFLLT